MLNVPSLAFQVIAITDQSKSLVTILLIFFYVGSSYSNDSFVTIRFYNLL